MQGTTLDHAATLRPYLPGMLIAWLAEAPGTTLREVDGTIVFVDISGFTKMSERLARSGKVGAEEVTEVIGSVFARLLSVAYGEGGGLIKFGGDALLLLFTGNDHPIRGARAAVGMRKGLRDIGAIDTTAGKVTLRMSVGLHSGTFQFFLVGETHRELIITGPAATETVSMEGAAVAGEVLASRATAALLPASVLGKPKGVGVLLRSTPKGLSGEWPIPERSLDGVDLLSCIPVALREHVLAGATDPEHRQVTVGFIHYDGIDDLVREVGAETVAFGLDELVRVTQGACDKHGVTFLGTDVDMDGGKIILVAGAPSAMGDDEERMLLAVRAIADAETTIPVRIGVNKGPVFSGEIGPPYRRTYTVMGDAVNLAARVMSKAEPGEVLATEPVLEASSLHFETEALEPFMVKGKKHPVVARKVGKILGSSRTDDLADLGLVGRVEELGVLRSALESTLTGGVGTLIQITGDAGIGKSRLVKELRGGTPDDVPWLAVSCELYEASTPYFPFRSLLRGLFGIPDAIEHGDAVAMFSARVGAACPELLPWLPLLAVPLDLEIPDTPEVAALEERFRREQLERAIGDLLVEFSKGPAVAVIEDAQWMDDASGDLLRAIAARMGELALLTLVADRVSLPAGSEQAEAHTIRLPLEPLSPADSVALIYEATEDHPLTPQAVEALVQRSGGGPRFLKSMLYALIESGGSVEDLPTSVEGLVMAQIDRLPPVDRLRLRQLSVLGMSFSDELARQLLEGEGIEDHLATSRAFEGLLEPDGQGGFRFRNGLVRDVAYESLPFRRRRELHARVGAAIESDAGEEADDFAELLAFHFLHSNEAAKAWRYARIAGERASGLYANVEARDFYLQALEAAPRVADADPTEVAALAGALGEVRERLGEFEDAEAVYRLARRYVSKDPLAVSGFLYKEARVSISEGRLPRALQQLTRGRKMLLDDPEVEAARLAAKFASAYGSVRWTQGRYEEAVRWCETAIEEGERSGGDSALAQGLGQLDLALIFLGRPGEAVHSSRALELYEQLGDLVGQGNLLNNLGGIAFLEGHWDEARGRYRRAHELLLRIGDRVEAARASANLAEILVHQGWLDEAETELRDARRVLQASGERAMVGFVSILLGTTAIRSGRIEEAEAILDEMREETQRIGDASRIAEVLALSAECMVLQGQADTAGELAEQALRKQPSGPFVPALLRLRGYSLLQEGRIGEAEERFRQSVEAAREAGALHEVAFTLEALLRFGLSDGRPEEDIRDERDGLFSQLGIIAVPNIPVHIAS